VFFFLFGLIFLVVGCGVIYGLTLVPLYRMYAAGDWQSTPCVIVSSEVERIEGDDGPTYRIKIVYDYQVEGRRHRGDSYGFTSVASSGTAGKQEVVDRFPPGSERTCYVNPEDPTQAVLTRDFTLDMLLGLFGVPFALVGGGVLLFASGVFRFPSGATRRVRRAPTSMPMRVAEPEPADAAFRRQMPGPTTLQSSRSPLGTLLVSLLFAAIWNGVVSIFVWMAYKSFRDGDPEWFLTVFITPFVLVGLAILVFAGYSFLALFNPRPVLTLSATTFALGDTLSLSWRFRGQTSSIRKLSIVLEGTEQAQYRRGTSTYTDTEEFARIPVIETDNTVEIPMGSGELTIPADSMHSFQAMHNEIRWAIVVSGEISLWPDVGESFPIEVLPHRGTGGATT
jgi:hypothetical protein